MKTFRVVNLISASLALTLFTTETSRAQGDHSCGSPVLGYLVNTPDEIVYEIDHLSQDLGITGVFGYIAPHHWWIPLGFLTTPSGPRVVVEVSSATDPLLVPLQLEVTTPWASPGGSGGILDDSKFATTLFYDYEARLSVQHWTIETEDGLRVCRKVRLAVKRRPNFLPTPQYPWVLKDLGFPRWMHPFVPPWDTVKPLGIVEGFDPTPLEKLLPLLGER